jgi:hypothetical protein
MVDRAEIWALKGASLDCALFSGWIAPGLLTKFAVIRLLHATLQSLPLEHACLLMRFDFCPPFGQFRPGLEYNPRVWVVRFGRISRRPI